jgi:glycosyltransferase involved in cell wall biosynthesis
MRITCVIGPFLPVPPLMGGAVERIFLALSTEFARRGHDVTVISRRFKGLANREVVDGVRHIRLPSHDAPASRVLYRLLDVLYALRVLACLPRSDVTITHSVFLPVILPKRLAGNIYVSVGRFPKRQMGFYRRADRLQAVSSHIGAAIRTQSPSVAHLVKVVPNAIGDAFSAAASDDRGERRREIVYVGRLAREKGIDLLLRVFARISEAYPDWRLVIIGPHEPKQGGDGAEFLDELKSICAGCAGQVDFAGPVFDEAELIRRLKSAEIFVYPSTAARGESFGLAPVEAMACGCAVLLSNLDCFADYLHPEENGLRFDHTDESGLALAEALRRLIVSPDLRRRLARAGVETSRRFAPSRVADVFLQDFEDLIWRKVRGCDVLRGGIHARKRS